MWVQTHHWATAAARTRQYSSSRAPSCGSSHSQITMGVHPLLISASKLRRSLATLLVNLCCQKSARVFGVVANRQPACRCQKQPWTKSATLSPGNARSGEPGNRRSWSLNRRPAECRYRRTRSSGLVFLPAIPAIIRDRAFSSTMSVTAEASPNWLGPSAETRRVSRSCLVG